MPYVHAQESSCKDQLLMDASFKMQLLGMSLVQKDMQLGLSSLSQFEKQQKTKHPLTSRLKELSVSVSGYPNTCTDPAQ